jgi:hypothetical protein
VIEADVDQSRPVLVTCVVTCDECIQICILLRDPLVVLISDIASMTVSAKVAWLEIGSPGGNCTVFPS